MSKSIIKNCIIVLVLASSLFLLTACTSTSSSYMFRSLGLGENVLPIEKRDFAAEYFNSPVKATDFIIQESANNNEEITYYNNSGKAANNGRAQGINFRFGMGNKSELKIGLITGKIYKGNWQIDLTSNNGEILPLDGNSETSFRGVQVGFKYLVTEYSDKEQLSLFLEASTIQTNSNKLTSAYDGYVREVNTALIFGYVLSDYLVPNISTFYSYTNTNRANTLASLPSTRNLHSIGGEINLNLNYGLFYANLYTGIQKNFSGSISAQLVEYTGTRVGLHFKMKRDPR